MISHGFSKKPIEQIDWFERYENPPCLNHQPINSDALEGAIRNPIQQEEVVGRAFSGSVCSLLLQHPSVGRVLNGVNGIILLLDLDELPL